MSNSPSRSRGACLRPGFATLLHSPPTRVGGAPTDVRVLGGTPVGYAITRRTRRLRGALRPMTRDARLSALHRGGFGPRGRASLTDICAGSVTASSSHPGRSAWRAGSRASRGERLRAAAAGRHASLRVYFRQAIEFYGFSVGRAEPSALASTPTHGGCPQARSISAFAACRATPAMPARA